nr:rhodanese-like domain-containing protein [Hyunsoonleella aquatilis]
MNSKHNFEQQELSINCEQNEVVSIQDIIQKENILIIDVREIHEQPKIEELSVISIPLSVLEHKFQSLKNNREKYFFCKSGMRSKKAVQLLKEKGIKNCFSIKEGASEILKTSQNRPVRF